MAVETKNGKDPKRPIGTISIDTRVVYDRLKATQIGETVLYADLTKLIGRDIRGVASWVLQSARRKALHDDQLVFGSVRNEGVRRLADTEIVDTGHDAITQIHRRSVRSLRKLASVQDFSALPPQDKVRHNAYASLLSISAHATRDKQVKKIEQAVEKSQAALAVQRTLDALKE